MPKKYKSPARHKKENGFKIYLNKVSKQIHPKKSLSYVTLAVMNDMMFDLLDKLAKNASDHMKNAKRHTLTERDMDYSLRPYLDGELVAHARQEGIRAVKRLNTSRRNRNVGGDDD